MSGQAGEGAKIRGGALWLYGGTILALLALQFLYTKAAMSQISYEELGESVRNVFWLEQRAIFDGNSSNVGWYGLLLIVYRLFGFSLFTAKYVRLALHLVALLCAASLLRRWLGERRAIPALAAVGLSPVLLYFNTLQTSYGLDLQYFVIVLYLLFALPFDGGRKDLALHAALGGVAMLACMSYPTFILYVPSLGVLYVWRWKRSRPGAWEFPGMGPLSAALTGTLLPLAIAFLYVQDRRPLILDPVYGTGIFRGGGRLDWNWPTLYKGLSRFFYDLFDKGDSYYFVLPEPDFSGPFMPLSLAAAIIAAALLAARSGTLRLPLSLIAGHIVLNLILPNFADNPPGIRKCTGAVVGLYALYLVVYKALYEPNAMPEIFRRAALVLLLLLPAHHLYSYAVNWNGLREPRHFAYETWLGVAGDPEKSLRYGLKMADDGKALFCAAEQAKRGECRYAEIYATVAGYRLWNGLPEKPMYAYDWKKDEIIALSVDPWKSWYFPH